MNEFSYEEIFKSLSILFEMSFSPIINWDGIWVTVNCG